MKAVLFSLPPYEKVLDIQRGEILPLVLQSGVAMVKMHHTLRVCNLVIFFGIVDEEFVHGYLDFEKKEGKIESDE